MQDAYRLTASDRVLQKTPFGFDVSVWEFFWPLLNGACLVVARPQGHQALCANIAERFLGKNLEISYDALRILEPDEQFNHIGECLKISDLLPPEAGIKQVRGLLQVFKANCQASARYLPRKVCPTPITLFRARDLHPEDEGSEVSPGLQQQPTWGWDELTAQFVDLHVIPGDHITMFAEPHVQVLAKKLRTCLEQAQHSLY